MVRSLTRVWSIGVVVGFASAAYADLNLDVAGKAGHRWSTVKPAEGDSIFRGANEYTVSAGYRILDLPVAVNGDFGVVTNNTKDLSNDVYKATSSYGYEVAAGVKAWVPTSFLLHTVGTSRVVPYAKVGHTLFSKYTIKGQIESADTTATAPTVNSTSDGFNYHVGTTVAVTDRVGVTAEYMYTARSEKTKVSAAGEDVTVKNSARTHAALIGAEVAL